MYVKTLFTKAIEKKIGIIGITDYFTIEGYKRIRTEYLDNPTKLKTIFSDEQIEQIKKILVFPNVEFRINKIVQINKFKDGKKVSTENGRINFHVLFSNELPIKLIEEHFLHDLEFIYEADPDESDKYKKLKVDNLITLGQRLKKEQPDLHGSDLQIGMTNAVVDDQKIAELLRKNNDFSNKYLIIVPADEDLSEISWKSQDHLVRKILLSRAHGFFSANTNTILFGLGDKSTSHDDFIQEFKSIKPCIWGSDAHDYDRLFEPDLQKYCWIKADATFEGIRQILFEPRDRVYVGNEPELLNRVRNARPNYINSVSIRQVDGYDGRKGIWFKDFELQLGFELIAIIGNKGKGKSAIADIVALLGNSHVNKRDFSFLNNEKFCQRGYAENFIGRLKWWDNSQNELPLNADADGSAVERVKYIPQSYLEKLCNDEESGFKEEINKVVFSRLDDADKLGKRSFVELEAHKAETINQQIIILTNRIHAINEKIVALQEKTKPEYKANLVSKKNIRDRELAEHVHEREQIAVIPNPESDTNLTEDQRKSAETIANLNQQITELESKINAQENELSAANIRLSELQKLESEVLLQQRVFEEWAVEKTAAFSKHGLEISNVIKMSVNVSEIKRLIGEASERSTQLALSLDRNPLTWKEGVSLPMAMQELLSSKANIEKDLQKPFKDFQDYTAKIKEWEARQKAIIGNETTEETIKFYEAEIDYVDKKLPYELKEAMDTRIELALSIYDQKGQIQEIYNKIKQSISSVLSEYSAEQNITIATSFKVERTFYTQFFDYVNRYAMFYPNGDEVLRKLVSRFDFDQKDQVREFLLELQEGDVRFKDGRKVDFFDYLCSLSYLRPEYDLRLNGKSLNQLSPGEKGGLLLVFYLVLDRDNKPLIIDQPEDNLDNQSVAEILVPYIKRAKKLRQIIMVTHNPNLAIVADAEQIIYMDIDKENDYKVSFDSGGIENESINNHIVNILEGRMKAFNNRRVKYKMIPATV